ncbi:MAG: hotdog fold thioesterase [Pseudomonadota bacterium]
MAITDPEELAMACAAEMYARDPGSQKLGIEIETVRPQYARMRMTVEPWMSNGFGMCHGGFIFALADTAMAFASNAEDVPQIAMQANIDYMKAAALGEILTAEAKLVEQTGRTALWDIEVCNQDGEKRCYARGRTSKIKGTVRNRAI